MDYTALRVKDEWLNKGLRSAWIFGSRVGGDGAKEYVNGYEATIGTGITTEADALLTPSTTAGVIDIQIIDPLSPDAPFPYTFVVDAERVSGTIMWSYLQNRTQWFGIYEEATGQIKTTSNNSFDGLIQPSAGTADNTCIAVAHSNNDLRGSYRGGSVSADASALTPSFVFNTTSVTIGARRISSVGNQSSTRMRLFVYFQAKLSDTDLISLSADPYQVFESDAAEPFLLRHNPRTNKVIPVLSFPTVTDIGANCVRPRVTKGY